MFKLYLLNKWTFSIVALALGLLLWSVGLTATAVVMTAVAMSLIIVHGTGKSDNILTASFLSGAMIGMACLVWGYSVFALLLLLFYVYSVMKVISVKVAFSMFLGFVTPLWMFLPYYIYNHQELLHDGTIMINNYFQQLIAE